MDQKADCVTREIFLAGGCFWGIEKAMSGLHGVVETECGYANGDPHFIPDYMLVCSGRLGYRETVRVRYNPEVRSLGDILHAFFFLIDPTQERRQGNDVGIQYQTGIYWSDPSDEAFVRKFMEEESERYSEFHTECGPLTFWSPAEECHQRYLDRNPGGYCHIPLWKMELLGNMLRASRTFK